MNLIYTTCFLDISGVTKINFDILSKIKSNSKIHVCVTARDDHLVSTWDIQFLKTFDCCFKLWQLNASDRYRYFVDYVKRHRIDLVFNTHSLWLYEHAACLKRDCPGLKIVDSLHVLEPCRLRGGFPDISANRFIHPYMDKTILISEDLRHYLIMNYTVDPAKLVIVKNGINTSNFMKKGGEKNLTLREELCVPGHCKLVGFIGRFTEQKRPFLFLEVARYVLKRRSDTRFYLVGDGPLASELERRVTRLGVGDSIALLPPRNDIPGVLNSTDLLVLTSLYEGAPLTVMEALASGVPVVASDVGAIREYVRLGCDLIATAPWGTEVVNFGDAVLGRLAQGSPPQFDSAYFDISRVVKEYLEVFCAVCSTDSKWHDHK